MLKSSVCRQGDIESHDFIEAEKELRTRRFFELQKTPNSLHILHRKSWEYSYITIALRERGMLQSGKRGLGFAVGCEPLPSFFASKGCEILATDLWDNTESSQAWVNSGENAGGNIRKLNELGFCPDDVFRQNVSYRNLDMNQIPEDTYGKFDFCWSSCAIEHVGSLKKSKEFLKNMLNVLKPGGIAVHTTEYNLTSNILTYDTGNSVIYRKRDLLEIAKWLREHGHQIEELDLRTGNKEGDNYVDMPPYYAPPAKYHIKMCQIQPFSNISNKWVRRIYYRLLKYRYGNSLYDHAGIVTTSVGLIIRKGQ